MRTDDVVIAKVQSPSSIMRSCGSCWVIPTSHSYKSSISHSQVRASQPVLQAFAIKLDYMMLAVKKAIRPNTQNAKISGWRYASRMASHVMLSIEKRCMCRLTVPKSSCRWSCFLSTSRRSIGVRTIGNSSKKGRLLSNQCPGIGMLTATHG